MEKKRLTSVRANGIKTGYWSPAKKQELVDRPAEYEDAEESGKLLLLPAKVGDTVYEVIVDDFPEWCCYVEEYELQDISVNGFKYADNWVKYDFPEIYLNNEEAQKRCDEIKKEREQMLLGYGCKCCNHRDGEGACMNPESDEYGEWTSDEHWCKGFTPIPEWKKQMLRQFNRRTK